VSVTVRPRRCRCVAIVTQLGTQIGAGEWVREADSRRIAARSQGAAVYALGTWAKIEARPAHPVGGWAGGGFDFLIEVRSVQGLCGSVPRNSVPVRSSMRGSSSPVRCTSVVTFSWTVATSAARSRSVANQPRPPTPASFTRTSTGRPGAPAARANTRRAGVRLHQRRTADDASTAARHFQNQPHKGVRSRRGQERSQPSLHTLIQADGPRVRPIASGAGSTDP
jgi:hypothetical protein